MPSKKKAAEPAAPPEEDVSMDEAPAADVELPARENHDSAPTGLDEQRIQILPGFTDTAASFQFLNEDHTLGNSLRYIIMKNPDVEFCGYSIPHPSEPKMNIRIQTYEGTTAIEALEKGFDDLMDLCDVVVDKFVEARVNFDEEEAQDNI